VTFVSATRLRVRSRLYLLPFFWWVWRTYRQAKRSPGHLASRLLADSNRAYWTLTAWDGEPSMRAYRDSGSHRAVMPKLARWCDEAHVVHWEQPLAELPDWSEVHHRMVTHGRRSKVNHPTPAHQSMDIPLPKGTRGAG
jgi:hypothetical protein